MLIPEYISFSIISDETITKEILAEKLCDYFEKMELKTGKTFEKQAEIYIENIDSIVGRKIAKPVQQKKSETPAVVPRARKYYQLAANILNMRTLSMTNMIDFSRTMFCLYSSIIKNGYHEIDNFDLSVSSLLPEAIISSMKTERDHNALNIMKRMRFDIKELYCMDTCTFIISIIMLHTIVNSRVQGEYYHV